MSQQTVYASAARTATPTAVVVNTRRAKALYLVFDVTAVTATPSIVTTVDMYDSLSNSYTTLFTSAAVATVSRAVYKIGPGITAAANLAVLEYLPDQVRITCTHGDADSATYSVSAHLLD